MSICLTCEYENRTGVTVDDSKTNVAWGIEIGVSEGAIRRHRIHRDRNTSNQNPLSRTVESSDGSFGATITHTKQFTLKDAEEWVRRAGKDPADYVLTVDSRAYGNGMWSNGVRARPVASAVADIAWPVVQPAEPVNISITPPSARPARDGLKLSLKCADTQIGFRAVNDDEYESFHDEKAMAVFLEVCRQEQPDSIVILGDFLDLPSQGKYIQEAGFARTTQMALNAGYRYLASLRSACPEAHIVLIEGNHDKRMQNFIENNALAAFGLKRAEMPESWPVMSLPNLLRLDELSVEYQDAYPAATYWDDDNTRNIHGTRANSRGSTTSQYSNDLPHISTWVGHTHRTEITYKTVLGPRGEVIESYTANPGCLCKTDGTVPSVHGALHADGGSARVVEDWQQGFGGLLYGNGEAWPQVWRIKDGRTVYQGRAISAY